MNDYFTALLAALLAGATHSALAASAVDLSVKGNITPEACAPSLSNNGLVEYGKVSHQDLNVDRRTQLPDKTLDLTIQCDAPVRFGLLMRDNREGSALVNSQIYYGLNVDNSGNKIGVYSLHFDPASTTVDAWSQVYRTDSTTDGRAWSSSNSRSIPVASRSYLGFVDVVGSTAGPIAIQNLTSRVTVETVIAPTSELDLSSDVRLDGSATLDVVYL
jgi:type 1 fimbria pilin